MSTQVADDRDLLPSLDEVREAQELIYSIMQPTPQLSWPLLNQRLGANIWVKHENHTPIGAFKARTAIVHVDALLKREKAIRGLITATRGNHGQSVALAGQRFNVPVTIVVPRGNSSEKNAAMRGQGANLIEFGTDFQEAREYAQKLADEQGLHMVSPFHRDFLKGVGTYWVELFSAVPDLDVAYVPIGMGSGICSGCAVRNGMNLKTKLVGVVSEGALSHKLSFEAGRVIAAPVTTEIADGVAVRLPDEEALEIMLRNVDHIVSVSDDEAREAMRICFTTTHNTVEGAGALAFAAALKEKDRVKGKRVALVVSGGNVDREVFAKVLMS